MKEQSIQSPEPDSVESTDEQEAPAEAPSTQRRGFAAWIQFPRRAVLLVGAYLLAILFLAALWRPEAAIADPRLSAGERSALSEQMGLNVPIAGRYAITLRNFFAGNFGLSFSNYPQLVSEVVSQRIASTLTLLTGGIIVSVLLTLVGTAAAVSIHKLEERAGIIGSVLKGMGRLVIFPRGTAPLIWLSFLVAWLYAFKLGLFPIGKRVSPALWQGAPFPVDEIYSWIFATGVIVTLLLLATLLAVQLLNKPIVRWGVQMAVALGIISLFMVYWGFLAGEMTPYTRDILLHLILPCTLAAGLPAMLTAQALSRELTLPREGPDNIRSRIGFYLKGLGVLFGQTAGWLGALVLVEAIFSYPGLGFSLVVAVDVGDIPAAFGILTTMAAIVLWGRLLSELFHWLARLVGTPTAAPLPEPTPARKMARKTWVIVTVSLIAIPLLLFFAGSVVHPILLNTVWNPTIYDPVLGYDISQIEVPGAPGVGHPLGTDVLGRDILSQLLSGSSTTLIMVWIAAIVAFGIALPCGAMAGWLIERRTWWSETLADLLLFPLDILLMLPVLPMLMLLAATNDLLAISLALCAGFLLIPRGARAYQTLWAATPKDKKWRLRLLPGAGALLLGSAFMALYSILPIEFFGFANLRMSLGTMLFATALAGYLLDFQSWWLTFPAANTAWLCLFIFYAAADALVGYFPTKQALVRMNE